MCFWFSRGIIQSACFEFQCRQTHYWDVREKLQCAVSVQWVSITWHGGSKPQHILPSDFLFDTENNGMLIFLDFFFRRVVA